MTGWGIQWSDPDSNSAFMLSLEGPTKSGWYSALIEIEGGEPQDILKTAQGILEERGFYRPHDNWLDWEEINTTYMRKQATYHQIKVRKSPGAKSNDEEE